MSGKDVSCFLCTDQMSNKCTFYTWETLNKTNMTRKQNTIKCSLEKKIAKLFKNKTFGQQYTACSYFAMFVFALRIEN